MCFRCVSLSLAASVLFGMVTLADPSDHSASPYPDELEKLDSTRLARLAAPVNTIPIAELQGISDTVVVWFKFKLNSNGNAIGSELLYNPAAGKIAAVAKSIVDTLTFVPPSHRNRRKTYYYGLPICLTCKTPEPKPVQWSEVVKDLDLQYMHPEGDSLDPLIAQWPTIVRQAVPEFPSIVIRDDARVNIECVLDSTGAVLAANVRESSGILALDLAAAEAGFGCEFTPFIYDGQPSPCHVTFTYLFQANGDPGLPSPFDPPIDLSVYPEMTFQGKPEYPRAARNDGKQGTVHLQILVNTEGRAQEARVSKSSGFLSLDEAAVVAALKCRFKSGMLDGKPVPCWVDFKYDFTLRN